MRKDDYGAGTHSSSGDSFKYRKGSSDWRQYVDKAYEKDMYDVMTANHGYAKSSPTSKNKKGTTTPNTGIQGSATSKTQDKSKGVDVGSERGKGDYGKGNPYKKSAPGKGGGKGPTSAAPKSQRKREIKTIQALRDRAKEFGADYQDGNK